MSWTRTILQLFVNHLSTEAAVQFRFVGDKTTIVKDMGLMLMKAGDKRVIRPVQFQGRTGELTVKCKYLLITKVVLFATFTAHEFEFQFDPKEMSSGQERLLGPFLVWKDSEICLN